MGQYRVNGRHKGNWNGKRETAHWQCPFCLMRVKGTPKEVKWTQIVHNCGLENSVVTRTIASQRL